MEQNATAATTAVAARIAAATATRVRRPDYAGEVNRLMEAAREVIEANGTAAGAKVADIVSLAGLSNDAFYRHFKSKDALVAALIEDGSERVAAAIAQRMAKDPAPEAKVRRWLDGMLSVTSAPHAESTSAVLWNSSNHNAGIPTGSQVARRPLAVLLHDPFDALGSANPDRDANLVTHAIVGIVAEHLWARTRPNRAETAHLLRFCLAVPNANSAG